jgi:hypothetical protein
MRIVIGPGKSSHVNHLVIISLYLIPTTCGALGSCVPGRIPVRIPAQCRSRRPSPSGCPPMKSRFTVSRTGQTDILWCRFRDQKGNSGSIVAWRRIRSRRVWSFQAKCLEQPLVGLACEMFSVRCRCGSQRHFYASRTFSTATKRFTHGTRPRGGAYHERSRMRFPLKKVRLIWKPI